MQDILCCDSFLKELTRQLRLADPLVVLREGVSVVAAVACGGHT